MSVVFESEVYPVMRHINTLVYVKETYVKNVLHITELQNYKTARYTRAPAGEISDCNSFAHIYLFTTHLRIICKQ